jgi:hypothetical protein
MSDSIRVNGNVMSWGSIVLKIGGERFYGFNQITYGDSRERVKAYGMGRHHAPRARTRGKYQTDPVVLVGPKGTIQALRELLAQQSPNGASYGDAEVGITVQFIETGDKPQIVELERCVLTKDSSDASEGADPLNDSIEFDTMLIRRNGLTLFDSSQGSP